MRTRSQLHGMHNDCHKTMSSRTATTRGQRWNYLHCKAGIRSSFARRLISRLGISLSIAMRLQYSFYLIQCYLLRCHVVISVRHMVCDHAYSSISSAGRRLLSRRNAPPKYCCHIQYIVPQKLPLYSVPYREKRQEEFSI